MRNSLRCTFLLLGLVLLAASAVRSVAQTAKSEPSPFSSQARPGYTKASPLALASAAARLSAPGVILVYPANAATSREVFLRSNNAAGGNATTANARHSTGGPQAPGGNIPGLDTLPTFAGAFAAQGGPSAGNVFPYVMIGNSPALGGVTDIPAQITTVSLNLLNPPAGFSARVPFSFEGLFTNSPNFEGANYTSGQHIQFADAVQRAEFFNTMGATGPPRLTPNVPSRVPIDIPRQVQVQLPDGSIVAVQSYFVGRA